MTFGPELPPEEQARRLAIVTRVGLTIVAALVIFVFAAALIGPFLFGTTSGRSG